MEAKTLPRKEKIHLDKSQVKVMVEVLFNYEGVIHYKFIPGGQTVNKELYLQICKMQSDENHLKNGQQMIGFFYMTMLHHITLCLWKSILPGTVLPSGTPSLFSQSSPADF